MSYIELNSDVLNTQRETLSNQLSNTINNKKFYLGLMDYYSRNIDLLNVELNGNLILINETLDKIYEIEKEIELLYVSKSKIGFEYNFELNNSDNIDIDKYYNSIMDYEKADSLLNRTIDYRILLVKKYEDLYRICTKNVSTCDYNISNITKTLNNIDNAYFVSNDKISTRYITPKVKKLKHYCVLN